VYGEQANGARRAQIIGQFGARICDLFGKTSLIQFPKLLEISRQILA
jgi:hypothetical protein